MRPAPADVPTFPEQQPAEGPDMGLPGADRPQLPPDRGDELPERLGERIADPPHGGVSTGEPDLLPNVEVPEETM